MTSSSTDNPANIKYAVFKLFPYEDFNQISESAPKNNLLICCDFDNAFVDHGQKNQIIHSNGSLLNFCK